MSEQCTESRVIITPFINEVCDNISVMSSGSGDENRDDEGKSG